MPSSASFWSMLMGRDWSLGCRKSTLAAADREARPALADRHQLQRIDVEMGGQAGHPPYGARNVFGSHRLHVRIERVRRSLVAAGANEGELSLDHAGLDRGDANSGPLEVAAEPKAKLADESLGAGI